MSYARRSIEALLERFQTSISEVLRGNNTTIHISAYKRGHPVLDKTLAARQDPGKTRHNIWDTKGLVFLLRIRIQEAIDRVCKDTCSLNHIPDDEGLGGVSRGRGGDSRID